MRIVFYPSSSRLLYQDWIVLTSPATTGVQTDRRASFLFSHCTCFLLNSSILILSIFIEWPCGADREARGTLHRIIGHRSF